MKQRIIRNEKNIKFLNSLITNGFYKGYIGQEKFELIPNHFINNYRIIGVLNENNAYELEFDYNSPMNIASKLAIIVIVIASIIFLANKIWIFPVLFSVFGLILFINFNLKRTKELNILTDKFLEFHKSENQ
ncbi:hypothetical protein [Mesonia sp. K7]|uniref:hypothetical protein n=1 Tax=Mesonia sp. K7 TaxID=2218606 RepID=UPI000DA74975|nr:hypothetical protein [Mesonia sp. K7]PZD77042.1 hypothetical protein DNG35_10395 [Mesonia sp. K7]